MDTLRSAGLTLWGLIRVFFVQLFIVVIILNIICITGVYEMASHREPYPPGDTPSSR